MNRFLICLASCVAFATPGLAQSAFRATLDGSQEVPPVSTSAGGWGTVLLNADGSVTYELATWALDGLAAHIHTGATGTPGSVIVTLGGGPAVWSGTSAPLAAADVTELRAGRCYFNVHSATHAGGEIRGQILASPAEFAAFANGSQQVPPTNSAATARGTFVVNPNRTITYAISSTGIYGTMAHIHLGVPGMSGLIRFPLLPGPTAWAGTTNPLSELEFAQLQVGGMYFNIHTTAFPAGEIRGQIFSSGSSYGFGCDGAGTSGCTLSTQGALMNGRSISVHVTHGAPGGSGMLGIAPTPFSALRAGGCAQLIAMPGFTTRPIALDATGAGNLVLQLPPVVVDVDAYLQFVGLVGGTLAYTSNGWALRVEVL